MIVAISSGLRSLITLPKSSPPPPVLPEPFGLPPRLTFRIGTPSTIHSGSLLPVIEFDPRMRMFADPSCVPAPEMITPDTLPASWLTIVGSCDVWSSAVESCCCAVPSWLFSFSTPSAVTTMPVSWLGSATSTKSCVTLPRAGTTTEAVFGAYPTRRAATVNVVDAPVMRADGTAMLYVPSSFE